MDTFRVELELILYLESLDTKLEMQLKSNFESLIFIKFYLRFHINILYYMTYDYLKFYYPI